MAKGYDTNQERVAELASYGKELTRRSRSRCELCQAAGSPLRVWELAPVPKIPDPARCLMLCAECQEQAEHPKRFRPGERWRFLAEALWSELPVVQALAARLLRRQAGTEDWAREALEQADLDEKTEPWAAEAE